MDTFIRRLVIFVVTTAWAVNFVAPFFMDSYHPDPSLNYIFVLVIGGLLATDTKVFARAAGVMKQTSEIIAAAKAATDTKAAAPEADKKDEGGGDA